MFCPVCKSEYRDGFTTCSACDATLVAQPDSEDGNPDAMEILWAGQDTWVSGELKEKLDAANILHKYDYVMSNFLPAFREAIYRIQIRKQDHNAALEATRGVDLYRSKRRFKSQETDSEPDSESENPTEDELLEGSAEPADQVPDDIVENFDPDDATSQAWMGPDRGMAQSIFTCLREVGIGCVLDKTEGTITIRVEPAAEARVKEIIREIVEQTPPE